MTGRAPCLHVREGVPKALFVGGDEGGCVHVRFEKMAFTRFLWALLSAGPHKISSLSRRCRVARRHALAAGVLARPVGGRPGMLSGLAAIPFTAFSAAWRRSPPSSCWGRSCSGWEFASARVRPRGKSARNSRRPGRPGSCRGARRVARGRVCGPRHLSAQGSLSGGRAGEHRPHGRICALIEEFLFRGVLLGLAVSSFGRDAGADPVSLVFAGVHFLKPAKQRGRCRVGERICAISRIGGRGDARSPFLLLGLLTLFVTGLILGVAALAHAIPLASDRVARGLDFGPADVPVDRQIAHQAFGRLPSVGRARTW